MTIHRIASRLETRRLDPDQQRDTYLLADLFVRGEIHYRITDLDRAIVGFACPDGEQLELKPRPEMRAGTFCERREVGILNIGEAGCVSVDDQTIELARLECLYVGRNTKSVVFDGKPGRRPEYYFVSYPAHRSYPTAKARKSDARRLDLGSAATANERTIYQYVHEEGIPSCQLVMGYTELKSGSVWNTMPPHTHDRRSELYLYFDVPEDNAVIHLMGEPQHTRHIMVGDRQVVLSPPWSIHSGCGTSNYRFAWAMGGENQAFDDMDGVSISSLR